MIKVLGLSLLAAVLIQSCRDLKNYAKSKIQSYIKMQKDYAEIQKIRLEHAKKCNAIKSYAMCISIDYKTKGHFNSQDKSKINKSIFNKIKEILNSQTKEVRITNLDDALIISSDNFLLFDKIYEKIMQMLFKAKSEIDKKYSVCLIPSITTDAYREQPDLQRVKKDHFNIKHCDFAGSFCTTNTFSKKYEFLKLYKYSGKSLGEYPILENGTEKNYKLNLVFEDLTKKLEGARL